MEDLMVEVKICGLKTPEAVQAAVEHEADYLGFVFYPPSPRFITPKDAKVLMADVPDLVVNTGLVVDPTDQMLDVIFGACELDMIQLHGDEPPERIQEIRERYEVRVAKALGVATKEDMARALDYEMVADLLIFDAKAPEAPKPGEEILPGGNGEAFDWTIMQDASLDAAWMLSGGLTPANVMKAIELTGAEAVDVSSGVENRRGEKDPDLIAAFLDIVHGDTGEDDDGFIEI